VSQPIANKSTLIAVGALCALALARSQIGFDPFPRWSGDPTLQEAPLLSLTPLSAMIIDALMIIVSAVTIRVAKVAVHPLSTGMLLVGSFTAMVLHRDFDDLVIASGWVGAITTGFTLFHVCSIASVRSFALAALFAGIAAAFMKGLSQYLIEHPASVEMFLANKQAVFDAQGWSADSVMARSYERRIMQSEASGWFGISNILATFSACATVFFGVLLTSFARTKSTRGEIVSLATALICSLVTLILTKSKGGFVACGVGFITGAFVIWVAPRLSPRSLRLILPCIAALSLFAIATRWLIGERIDELSLFFRGMYIEAAIRIFLEHPFGVGAGGFKDAYLLLKNPLSPEDVASPHSVFLDWIATLGVFGFAWCAIVMSWITVRRESAPQHSEPTHVPSARSLLLVLAAPALLGAMIERAGATPEAFAVRLGSILLGLVIAAAVLRGSAKSNLAATFGAIAVLIAHAQIELTPTASASAPWFFALLGALCSTSREPATPSRATPLFISAACVPLLAALPSVVSWEYALARAWLSVHELPELLQRRNQLASDNGRGIERRVAIELYEDLETRLGFKLRPTDNLGRSIDEDLKQLRIKSLMDATKHLDVAWRAQPTHFETLRALSRVSLEAEMSGTAIPSSAGYAKELESFAKRNDRATAWAWLAVVRETSGAPPADIAVAWSHAFDAAPFDPMFAFNRAVSAHKAGNRKAADYAAEALKIDELQRLDPLRRLREAEISRLREISGV
jgi:hypothetical protein